MTSQPSSGAIRETAPQNRGPASEESPPPPNPPAPGGGGHPTSIVDEFKVTIAAACQYIDQADAEIRRLRGELAWVKAERDQARAERDVARATGGSWQ